MKQKKNLYIFVTLIVRLQVLLINPIKMFYFCVLLYSYVCKDQGPAGSNEGH